MQTWRIIVAELYACSAALEAIGMGFGWRPPASITATLFAVFVFDIVLSFNTLVAVWPSSGFNESSRRLSGALRVSIVLRGVDGDRDAVTTRAVYERRAAAVTDTGRRRVDGVHTTQVLRRPVPRGGV